jgi:plastocyanin
MIRYSPLVLILALVVGCGGYSSTSPSTTAMVPGTPVSIVSGASTLTATAYSPNPLTVSPGTQVSWVNNDGTTHTSVSDTGAWSSGNIAPGAVYTTTFNTAGTYTYHCSIHPNMIGTVKVQ